MALSRTDDGELIARLRRRDPTAMAEMYDCYGRTVYSVVLRIVRDQATAEDLVQEVFLRVWNRAHQFEGSRGALAAWLFTISRNQALDFVRSTEGRNWSTISAGTERLPARCIDAERGLLDTLRVQQIQAAIAKLNESQRRVVEMAYFEGLSQTEMAERLQQPLGTIKTWARSALRVLREELSALESA